MNLESEIHSTHFRKKKYTYGLEIDVTFLLSLSNNEESLVVKVVDSIGEGNWFYIDEINGESIEDRDHDLNMCLGSKSSLASHFLNVAESLLDSEISLTKDEVKGKIESILLDLCIEMNDQSVDRYG